MEPAPVKSDISSIISVPLPRKRHPSVLEQQKSIFSSIEYDPTKHARVLVLYTGGTIGMCWENGSYCPKSNFLVDSIKKYPHLHDRNYSTGFTEDDELRPLVLPDCHEPKKVLYFVKEYDPLLDSSNMTVVEWKTIATDIQEHYDAFDGFVVLHGTDTMSYTASALSFMLENLGKPVILTGSQIPIFEVRSDGRDNFIGALVLAGTYKIPEVCLYFNHKLFRGNRSTKIDNSSFDAFDSPNMKPLAHIEIQIYVDNDSIFRPHKLARFSLMTNMNQDVAVLRLFPSITAATVRSFLQPPIKGMVLQSYGAGNGPQRQKDILEAFREAHQRGVIIVNISQCARGVVSAAYETGKALFDLGIIPGHDMTPEAALAKLSYVLGKAEWNLEKKREMMLRNLRGELTVKQSRLLSVVDADLIEAVAQVMQLSSSKEMGALRRVLFPSLICNAARIGSVPRLETIRNAGGNLSMGDYDGNTALHIAASNGLVDVVRFLIDNGVNVLAEDRWGLSPLDNAVQFSRFEIIAVLRAAGAQLNMAPIKLGSQLCCAAAKNEVGRLKSFALAGANMDQEDYNGCTALFTAVHHKSFDCVQFLMGVCSKESMERKNPCGHTPLTEAARLSDKDILNLLTEGLEKTGSS